MKAILNGFTINDGSAGFYLDAPVSGLSLPAIRTSQGVYSGRDGGFVSSQFYGMREITLVGTMFGQDITDMERKRRLLQEALRGDGIELKIITDAGNSYVMQTRLTAFDLPVDRTPNIGKFKIELLAPDPIIYDDTNGKALIVNIQKITSGGYLYPVVYPVVYRTGDPDSIVTNDGNALVYPIVRLTGAGSNPIVTNLATGFFIKLTNLTMSQGDELVIDMKKHTVLLNGGSVYYKLSSDSTFWGLDPGDSPVGLQSASLGDSIKGTVEWRSGYMGI